MIASALHFLPWCPASPEVTSGLFFPGKLSLDGGKLLVFSPLFPLCWNRLITSPMWSSPLQGTFIFNTDWVYSECKWTCNTPQLSAFSRISYLMAITRRKGWVTPTHHMQSHAKYTHLCGLPCPISNLSVFHTEIAPLRGHFSSLPFCSLTLPPTIKTSLGTSRGRQVSKWWLVQSHQKPETQVVKTQASLFLSWVPLALDIS